MSKKITVLGSGSWGTAISVLLFKNGHDVTLWSHRKEQAEELQKTHANEKYLPGIKLPMGIFHTHEIETAVKDAEIIFMVTPSSAVAEVAEKIAPFVLPQTIIVSASKGIEQKSLKRMSEVIKSAIPKACVAVMSGPSHAEEVARELPTTNTVVSEDIEVSQLLQDVLMCDMFRVYTGTDMAGVELGGALKNVIALCAGISDGLGFGDNTKAALMTRGMAEIARLGIALGAEPQTFFGLSGMGDLIVTCTSKHSRNRRAGILIGKGYTPKEALNEVKMVVEGFYTTKAAYALAQKMGVEMPITEEAYKVLFENKPAKDAVLNLMCRDKRHESEQNLMEN